MLSCGAFCLASYLLTSLSRPKSRVEGLLIFATALLLLITLTGYLISAQNMIANVDLWTMCAGGEAIMLLVIVSARKPWRERAWRRPVWHEGRLVRKALYQCRDNFDTFVLVTLGLIWVYVIIVGWFAALKMAPSNMDVLEYHLGRVGYYLQHGNIGYYPANNWMQNGFPKISSLAMLYAIVASDRQVNYAHLVQFFAYPLAGLAVYGVTRLLGAGRRGSLFAALVFSLLTIVIAEMSTAQNDLLLAAMIGCLVYALLAFRASQRLFYLGWAAIALALAAGIKITLFFSLPGLALISGYALLPWLRASHPALRRELAVALAVLVLALACITLPSCYYENLRHDGSLTGSKAKVESMTSAALPGPASPVVKAFAGGVLNLGRYGASFLSLDGFWDIPVVDAAQHALAALPRGIFTALKMDLESHYYAVGPFRYFNPTGGNENYSFWGVLGFLLIWPVVFVTLCRRSSAPGTRVFAAAALLFLLTHAFANAYSPWNGRYYMTCAIFATPLLAFTVFPNRHVIVRAYLAIVVVLGALSAFMTATARDGFSALPIDIHGRAVPRSSFEPAFAPQYAWLERCMQLTREDHEFTNGLALFEYNVPIGAVVGIETHGFAREAMPKFIFFGEKLTRSLIPLDELAERGDPLPANIDYLLYNEPSRYARPTDTVIIYSNKMGKIYLQNVRYPGKIVIPQKHGS